MDVPDLAKKAANDAYRQSLGKTYDVVLEHRFYNKDFFKEICSEAGLECKIWDQNIEGYKNSEFRFNILVQK